MIKIQIQEIGLKMALKYLIGSIMLFIFKILFISPVRVLFLKFMGAKIGKGTVIEDITFINLYRKGFRALKIGEKCFLGSGTMLDLADEIILEDSVTIAERVIILTHFNVGYKDHPLQNYYPPYQKPVRIKSGSFIGSGTIILPGVIIGSNSVVGAGSLVRNNVPDFHVVGGTPAKTIKVLKKSN